MSAAADNQTNSSAADFSDQAFAAQKQAKDSASGVAQSATETIRQQAAETANDIAAQAGEKLQDEATNRKNQAAEYVDRVAEAMRRAAGEFEPDLPIAASYIRTAAKQVTNASASLRNGDFRDLVDGAQSFARSQPTAFLGFAALGGFALARFLKSSARETQKPRRDFQAPGDYH